MNQDKYPGIYAAMGDMDMRHYDCFPMCEMGMRAPERMPVQKDNWYRENMHADCIDRETELHDLELAHAYVPFQKFCPTFMPLTALKKGTAFPGLVDVYGWKPKKEMGGEFL